MEVLLYSTDGFLCMYIFITHACHTSVKSSYLKFINDVEHSYTKMTVAYM